MFHPTRLKYKYTVERELFDDKDFSWLMSLKVIRVFIFKDDIPCTAKRY